MTFDEFEAEALRVWEEIPESFKEGIDGIVVRRGHLLQEEYRDYYTLGTCTTEPYPSDYRGPATSRSILNLYYGSFEKVAEDDPDFPWEEEIWETVTHELRHHLEHLAEDDETDELDYAMEGTYRRGEGLSFDPWYFQSGITVGDGIYRVEQDVYVEVRWRPTSGAPNQSPAENPASVSGGAGVRRVEEGVGRVILEFEWEGARWTVPWPKEPGELHFLHLRGLAESGGVFELVLVKEVGIRGMFRRFIGRTGPTVTESVEVPEQVGRASGSA